MHCELFCRGNIILNKEYFKLISSAFPIVYRKRSAFNETQELKKTR